MWFALMASTQFPFHRRESNSSNLEEEIQPSTFDLHGFSMAKTSRQQLGICPFKFAVLLTVAVSAALVGVGITVLIHQDKCGGNQVGGTGRATSEVSTSTDCLDVKSDCSLRGDVPNEDPILDAPTSPLTEQRKRFDLQHHKDLLREFQCGVPQRRLLDYSDLEVVEDFWIPIGYQYAMTPPQTVLYRCDSLIGFCSGQQTFCQPEDEEEVELEVEVEDVLNRGKIQTRWMKAWNHTKCFCAPVELPK